MKKQIVTIVLGAVVMLGTATGSFAQNGPATGGYPSVAGGAAGNPGFIQVPSGKPAHAGTTKVRRHLAMACEVFNEFQVNC